MPTQGSVHPAALGPFRVRNFPRGPQAARPQSLPLTEARKQTPAAGGSVEGSSGARKDDDVFGEKSAEQNEVVVSVSAEVYDKEVCKEPSARLKYYDKSDRTVFTVGSSFELIDRLSEPLSPSLAIKNNDGEKSPVALNRPVHSFFLHKPSEAACDIWQKIEEQTKKLVEQEKEEVEDEEAKGKGKETEEEARTEQSPAPQESIARKDSPTITGANVKPKMSESQTSLTDEGKRQASEFGEKIRQTRGFPSNEENASKPQNRWSSYSLFPAPFVPPKSSSPESSKSAQEQASKESPFSPDLSVQPSAGSLPDSFYHKVQAQLTKLGSQNASLKDSSGSAAGPSSEKSALNPPFPSPSGNENSNQPRSASYSRDALRQRNHGIFVKQFQRELDLQKWDPRTVHPDLEMARQQQHEDQFDPSVPRNPKIAVERGPLVAFGQLAALPPDGPEATEQQNPQSGELENLKKELKEQKELVKKLIDVQNGDRCNFIKHEEVFWDLRDQVEELFTTQLQLQNDLRIAKEEAELKSKLKVSFAEPEKTQTKSEPQPEPEPEPKAEPEPEPALQPPVNNGPRAPLEDDTVEMAVSKLVMQTATSIESALSTLQSQIQSFYLKRVESEIEPTEDAKKRDELRRLAGNLRRFTSELDTHFLGLEAFKEQLGLPKNLIPKDIPQSFLPKDRSPAEIIKSASIPLHLFASSLNELAKGLSGKKAGGMTTEFRDPTIEPKKSESEGEKDLWDITISPVPAFCPLAEIQQFLAHTFGCESGLDVKKIYIQKKGEWTMTFVVNSEACADLFRNKLSGKVWNRSLLQVRKDKRASPTQSKETEVASPVEYASKHDQIPKTSSTQSTNTGYTDYTQAWMNTEAPFNLVHAKNPFLGGGSPSNKPQPSAQCQQPAKSILRNSRSMGAIRPQGEQNAGTQPTPHVSHGSTTVNPGLLRSTSVSYPKLEGIRGFTTNAGAPQLRQAASIPNLNRHSVPEFPLKANMAPLEPTRSSVPARPLKTFSEQIPAFKAPHPQSSVNTPAQHPHAVALSQIEGSGRGSGVMPGTFVNVEAEKTTALPPPATSSSLLDAANDLSRLPHPMDSNAPAPVPQRPEAPRGNQGRRSYDNHWPALPNQQPQQSPPIVQNPTQQQQNTSPAAPVVSDQLRREKPPPGPAGRRPYSEHFDGSGRFDWENWAGKPEVKNMHRSKSFTARRGSDSGRHRHPVALHADANASTRSLPLFTNPRRPPQPPPPRNSNRQQRNNQQQQHQGQGQLQQSQQNLQHLRPAPLNPARAAAQTVAADVERCVAQLVEMGFALDRPGGLERLRQIAAAAQGDVYEAIGMLEEEAEAWEERKVGEREAGGKDEGEEQKEEGESEGVKPEAEKGGEAKEEEKPWWSGQAQDKGEGSSKIPGRWDDEE